MTTPTTISGGLFKNSTFIHFLKKNKNSAKLSVRVTKSKQKDTIKQKQPQIIIIHIDKLCIEESDFTDRFSGHAPLSPECCYSALSLVELPLS